MAKRGRAVARMVMGMEQLEFYRGKRVFLTGHTGFKGSWLCAILTMAGAQVTGYALPPASPSLYELLHLDGKLDSVYGDVRDLDRLWEAFEQARPEIVFHLAAQPIVREGYRDPVGTYSTNVMGTVHLLECVRRAGTVRSVLNVTTDKVYENRQWPWGYRESDGLNGIDPYANSKSCSELVTDSYRSSFLAGRGGKCHRRRGLRAGPDHPGLCPRRPKGRGHPASESQLYPAVPACAGAPIRLPADRPAAV